MSTLTSRTLHASGRERWLAHLAMLGFASFVAGSFSVGAIVAGDIAPAPLNAVRFALAALLMAVIAFGLGRHRFKVPPKPWRFAVYGALNGTYFVTMFVALTMTAPVATSAVFTLSPLLSAAIAYLVLGQKVRPVVLGSIAVAATGALWVIFDADFNDLMGFAVGPGETVFLFGCVAYALVSPLMRLWDQKEPGVVFTFWLLVGTTLCIALYGWSEIIATPWLSLSPQVWWSIIYLTIFPTALSFFLLQYASLRLPASKVMAHLYLLPGLVIVIEGLAGNGWADAAVMAGAALTVAALAMLAVWRD